MSTSFPESDKYLAAWHGTNAAKRIEWIHDASHDGWNVLTAELYATWALRAWQSAILAARAGRRALGESQ